MMKSIYNQLKRVSFLKQIYRSLREIRFLRQTYRLAKEIRCVLFCKKYEATTDKAAIAKIMTGKLESPLVFIDIGARGGIPDPWVPLENLLHIVCFEPDADECERLRGVTKANYHFYPVAIGKANERSVLHITRFPYSSGLPKTNLDYLSRFNDSVTGNLEIIGEANVETISLNSFCRTQQLREVNFLKVDTEGAEFDILSESTDLLRSENLFGVYTELWFGAAKSERDHFGRIHNLLQEHGFFLFNLATAEYSRKTFPLGRMKRRADGVLEANFSFGQILTGDALYLRDLIHEHRSGSRRFSWTDTNVLKMVMTHAAYDLFDCAIELLLFYRRNFTTSLNIDALINALTPEVDGVRNYQHYLHVVEKLDCKMIDSYKPFWTTMPTAKSA